MGLCQAPPLFQTTISGTAHHKLTKRYFEPFEILERIGNVAYRLRLPANSCIHPVFNCSLLRPHYGPLVLDTNPLPPHAVHNYPILKPLVVLNSKFDSSTSPPTRMVLIQWQGFPPEEATWEKWFTVSNVLHLEDKVHLSGEGIDSNQGRNPSPPGELEAEFHQEEIPAQEGRPKRNNIRPGYLKDFV